MRLFVVHRGTVKACFLGDEDLRRQNIDVMRKDVDES
jgi:hypothetical protein